MPCLLQSLTRDCSAGAGSPGIAAYDEKNIRRRVYDALNVLMAMDIIIKDKKDISWKGLPSAPHAQLEKLKEERAALSQKILNQQVYLQVCLPHYLRLVEIFKRLVGSCFVNNAIVMKEERTAVQVKILNQQAYLQVCSSDLHCLVQNIISLVRAASLLVSVNSFSGGERCSVPEDPQRAGLAFSV